MKIQLISNWKEAWKFSSLQLAAILGLLDTAYEYLPAVQTYLPEGWVRILAVIIIAARIIRQRKLKGGQDAGSDH